MNGKHPWYHQDCRPILLERRPDVAAAERRMASANAGIGFAEAAYYPSLRLGAAAGTQSIDAGSLFTAPSFLWALGAAVALPIFQGGQQQAAVRGARAGWTRPWHATARPS